MSRSRRTTWRDVRVKSERRQNWYRKCQCGRCTTSRGLRKGTYLADQAERIDNDFQERVRKDV